MEAHVGIQSMLSQIDTLVEPFGELHQELKQCFHLDHERKMRPASIAKQQEQVVVRERFGSLDPHSLKDNLALRLIASFAPGRLVWTSRNLIIHFNSSFCLIGLRRGRSQLPKQVGIAEGPEHPRPSIASQDRLCVGPWTHDTA
jgi:hypothetical protein